VPLLETSAALTQLPLVTLYLSERCNSRCVTCDYWRFGKQDVTVEAVRGLLPALRQLQTEVVLLSGGEPLLHPQWAEIAALLRGQHIGRWLLSSGLSLAKHARRVSELIDIVTVSLDGTNAATYERIRGLDAFDKVCEGITALADIGVAVTVRVTLQRANFEELPRFVSLARELGARQVSFLAVDVGNPHAFARRDALPLATALSPGQVGQLSEQVEQLIASCAEDFASGFIAESPRRLRHIVAYFRALCGGGAFPPVRCNAPEFSGVIDAHGALHPCFFIKGPGGRSAVPDLRAALEDRQYRQLRSEIRAGARPECATCVCSMWHEGGPVLAVPGRPGRPQHA